MKYSTNDVNFKLNVIDDNTITVTDIIDGRNNVSRYVKVMDGIYKSTSEGDALIGAPTFTGANRDIIVKVGDAFVCFCYDRIYTYLPETNPNFNAPFELEEKSDKLNKLINNRPTNADYMAALNEFGKEYDRLMRPFAADQQKCIKAARTLLKEIHPTLRAADRWRSMLQHKGTQV